MDQRKLLKTFPVDIGAGELRQWRLAEKCNKEKRNEPKKNDPEKTQQEKLKR